jgi:hypothetical protein
MKEVIVIPIEPSFFFLEDWSLFRLYGKREWFLNIQKPTLTLNLTKIIHHDVIVPEQND